MNIYLGLDFLLNGGILDPEDVENLETLYEVLKKICRMPDHEAQVRQIVKNETKILRNL